MVAIYYHFDNICQQHQSSVKVHVENMAWANSHNLFMNN